MSVVWRIAIRNLREHRATTLIVGTIILIGAFVLVVGNSLMDSAAAGIRRSFIDNFTGHLVLAGVTDAPVSLFGVRSTDALNTRLPRLDGYRQLVQAVAEHPDVATWSPQTSTGAAVNLAAEDGTSVAESYSQLWGIDPVRHREAFPDAAELIAGSLLQQDQAGVLLAEETATELAESAGRVVRPGDRVLLTAISEAGIKVREVPVAGIFRFSTNLPQLDSVTFVDVTTLRALTGMTVSAPAEQILTDEQVAQLGAVDEDDLFSGGGGLVQELETEVSAPVLLDLGEREATVLDSGAWHFLLLKLRSAGAADRVSADLERVIAEADLNAQVLGWVEAAAPLSQLSDGFQTVFNVVIIVIAVVAVIIIMNTLVIAVTERMSEIGTMRAIGARKGFVRRMIGAETVTLAFVFGAAGVVLAVGLLLILGATGIRATNLFLRILFGGEVLRPAVSPGAVAFSLLMVAAIAVLSSLYPLAVALRISPRQAMGTG